MFCPFSPPRRLTGLLVCREDRVPLDTRSRYFLQRIFATNYATNSHTVGRIESQYHLWRLGVFSLIGLVLTSRGDLEQHRPELCHL